MLPSTDPKNLVIHYGLSYKGLAEAIDVQYSSVLKWFSNKTPECPRKWHFRSAGLVELELKKGEYIVDEKGFLIRNPNIIQKIPA